MPVVIPAAPGSTSALQSVPTQTVFDYLYDSRGNPLKNAPVVVTLNVEAANSITPQVELSNVVVTTTTDNNGYWTVSLIPNANINPANTTYSVQAQGIPAYQIAIPSAGGPFQSTSPSVLVNTPGVLAPATTGITGNLTITGNETVTGTLAVSGTTTLAATTTGALTSGAATVGGDLTIGSAFRLLFGAAVAKIVGGATSLSLRNNADNADNVLVADNGDMTIRARLLLASAVSKLVPGATSFSVRDNADANDNLNVTNAGLATLRNAILLPPSAGGTLAPTSYGTVPVKLAEVSPSAVNSFTLASSIPTAFRALVVEGWAAATIAATNVAMFVVFNNDSASGYDAEALFVNGATVAGVENSLNGASGYITDIAGSTAPASTVTSFTMRIPNYASGFKKSWNVEAQLSKADSTGNHFIIRSSGRFRSTVAITRIDFNLASSNFTNATFSLWGYP